MTDVPVTHVANAHWHDDHTHGNHTYRQAFPGVKIVAHKDTLEALRNEWEPMEDERRATYAKADPEDLAGAVDLEDFRREFAGESRKRQWAWQTYFVEPRLKSAWTSLGYPLAADERQ